RLPRLGYVQRCVPETVDRARARVGQVDESSGIVIDVAVGEGASDWMRWRKETAKRVHGRQQHVLGPQVRHDRFDHYTRPALEQSDLQFQIDALLLIDAVHVQ